jgi:hypothetical protein
MQMTRWQSNNCRIIPDERLVYCFMATATRYVACSHEETGAAAQATTVQQTSIEAKTVA